MLSVIILNGAYKPFMLSVIKLGVIMLSVVMLSIVMLSVIILSVVAPPIDSIFCENIRIGRKHPSLLSLVVSNEEKV